MIAKQTNRLALIRKATLAVLGFCSLQMPAAWAVNAATASPPPPNAEFATGSSLPDSYTLFNGGKALASGAVSLTGALQKPDVQLPAGISLGQGSTASVGTFGQAVSSGFAAAATPTQGSKLISLYPMLYQGVPVSKGADYLTVVDENGKLLASRVRNTPRSVDAVTANVTADSASKLALETFQLTYGNIPADVGKPELEVWVDTQQLGWLSWKLTVKSANKEPKALQFWIAATGVPRVLTIENLVYHTHSGTVTETLWATSPLRPTSVFVDPDLTVTRTGGGTAVTNINGFYAFGAGSGFATLSSNLRGPFAVVNNNAGTIMQANGSGFPGTAINLNYAAAGEFQLAQTSAFYWANFAHRMAAGILGGSLANLPVNVNIADTCNAFWNGSSINFFRAGGSCPNTAYSDVVLHEYGHGVDSAKGGILDGGYSEGFGDAMAILGTRQSCLGRDFNGFGTCLRPATDVVTWPPANTEVHNVGRIYAGFTWALVQQLKLTLSENDAFNVAQQLVLAAAAANPKDTPDAVKLSFIADDDDGNLATCSPHFKQLAAAADSRNIPRPADCGPHFAMSRWATRQGGYWETQQWVSGDFNGDGKKDLAKAFNCGNNLGCIDVHLSTGTGFVIQRWATNQGGFWDAQKWMAGDFNGDGRADMVKTFNCGNNLGCIDVHLSTGAGFVIQRWATNQGGYWDAQKWLVGDFNGDGRADLAKAFNCGNNLGCIDVHPSSGAGFGIQRWATNQGGYWDTQKWLAGDFNSDGKSDVAKAFNCGNNLGCIDVHPSSGAGFGIQRWATNQGGYWDTQKWLAGDFNGDGRVDVGKAFNCGNNLGCIDVHPSSGAGFGIQRWATNQGGYWDLQKWLAGDFDGDRKVDTAKTFNDAGAADIDVHLSR